MQRAVRTIETAWQRQVGPIRPSAVDVGLAVVVAVAVAITIAVSVPNFSGMRAPDAFAYTLAALFGALMLVRWRWPVGVLLATSVLLQVYYWSDFPTLWPAIPLAGALFTAAAAGHLRWALAVVAWYWLIPLGVILVGALRPLETALNDIVRDGSLMLAVILFGEAVRSHRALMAEASERLRRAEEDRQREARELSAARIIQQQLLPDAVPELPGWRIAAFYQPARAVGGDFYDFIALPDGQIGIVSGDVTDKGIPSALVMATTHRLLRSVAPGLVSPGAVLKYANERLYPDIPPRMFVTCFYLLLDPVSGRLRYANAGHSLPYLATARGVRELRATGMPLGAMPGMTYEENETYLEPGDSILLHSDGLIEAHNAAGEMFGVPRLQRIVERSHGGQELIDACLAELQAFVGPDWEQEDDITFVTLDLAPSTVSVARAAREGGSDSAWRTLADLVVPSAPGNERQAMAAVAAAAADLDLSPRRLEQLKTAVAEATMNAMEHGNQYRDDAPVRIRVSASADELSVRITDEGSGPVNLESGMPDLSAKLLGQQPARGWGLFLIKRMVDEIRSTGDEDHHTVELIVRLDREPRPEGAADAGGAGEDERSPGGRPGEHH